MQLDLVARGRVGRWMRLMRERNGLTEQQVALGAGVSRNTLWTWEAGQRMPGLLTFVAWCRAAMVEPERAIRSVELLADEVNA